MFLTTVEVILLIVYLFHLIFIETSSVLWLRNQSRVFVEIFDYMKDLWLNGFNRMDLKRVGVYQSRV